MSLLVFIGAAVGAIAGLVIAAAIERRQLRKMRRDLGLPDEGDTP